LLKYVLYFIHVVWKQSSHATTRKNYTFFIAIRRYKQAPLTALNFDLTKLLLPLQLLWGQLPAACSSYLKVIRLMNGAPFR
jgi:hypothetical protein